METVSKYMNGRKIHKRIDLKRVFLKRKFEALN